MNKLYYGKIGGGKTHCALFQEIIPALRAGRPVFTNIDGLDVHALRNYIGKDININIRTSLKWWRESLTCEVEDDGEEGKAVLNPALVEGALYVIDECQFIWDAREFKDTKSGFLHLLEYNRHFSIDIIFITQNVRRCDVNIGRLANDSYQIKNLGFLHSFVRNRYCVNRRQTPFDKDVISQYTQPYQPAIFSLYRSGANIHDKKQRSRFSMALVLPFIILFIVGIVVLVRQGNPITSVAKKTLKKGVNDVNTDNNISGVPSLTYSKVPATSPVGSVSASQATNKKSIVSTGRFQDFAYVAQNCVLQGYVEKEGQRNELYDCSSVLVYVVGGKIERQIKKHDESSSSLKQAVETPPALPASAEAGGGTGDLGIYGNNSNTLQINK